MAEKTEAQKRAQKAYMEKFVRIEVRMTPEQRSIVQDTVDIFIAYNQTGREQPDPACGEKPVSDSKKYGRKKQSNG